MASKKGCLIWGCSITAVLALLIGGAIFWFTYGVYSKVKSYTGAKPMVVEQYEPTEKEYQKATEKANILRQALKNKESVTVNFTGDDINSLIAQDPKLKKFAGKVFVKIEGDELSATGSIPLKDLNLPIYKDRYLNGDFTLKITMVSEKIWLTMDKLVVDGKPVPDDFMKGFKTQNLLKGAYDNPRQSQELKKFKSVEVVDGKLIVVTK